MARIILFVFALFASFILTLASPVPVRDGELVEIDKRITHVGRGTWFEPGLGNCGQWNNANDLILAIGKSLYDRNHGSNCGQWVEIINTQNGKTAYGKAMDSCPGCGDNDLDMSPALFKKLGPLSQGIVTIKWHFKSRSFKGP